MKLPSLKHRKVIVVLKKLGFEEVRQTGSHLILVNQETKKIISVPVHNKDLKKGLLAGIIKQAGLTTEEFAKLL
ncbi:type II toxin-antitoxin system HicA family toxin [Candidatus Parcubacteria bacterium]|nr:MAG: type II toxin-antitoxin system HicA family toxin [Candidatus Parcubacteria bacterium]